MPVTVTIRNHTVPCVEVRPGEQDTHELDVPCCQCPGDLDQYVMAGETGDTPLVFTRPSKSV